MLEDLQKPGNRSFFCKIDLIQQDLEDADRAIFLDAIADTKNWAASTLARALRLRGISISDTTIGKHRHKSCTCFRK